ncbi:hypothetical protein [Paraburkholderia sp.]|uniref:hypothetical protein n=1 Tax=Paraburkholderia sp. TaxID=1926495 RepID=UPI003D6EC16F
MKRKTLNASRLQEEVNRRIHQLHAIVEDGVKIRVPRPQLQEPDKTGCNWTMKHFGNIAGFERDVSAVLDAVRAEYNLSEEAGSSGSSSSSDSDPFAGFPGN